MDETIRSTKIIATVGPTCEKPSEIKSLISSGMDVARFNFSHDTHEVFKLRTKRIRSEAKRQKKEVKILGDLKGPRIRIGQLPKEGRQLNPGEKIVFTTNTCKDIRENEIIINDPYLHQDVKKGDMILLDNGSMEVEVKRVRQHKIEAEVIQGGILFSNKGVNLPRTKITTPAITDKDREDVRFAIRNKFDFVALSFVGTGQDIRDLRKLLGRSKVKIIAKIERQEALENFSEILKESDGIMVARGDLGIEAQLENVPIIQKEIIKQCRLYNKPAIVATQMLDSMVASPIPTRAEVSDIANAVLDGASAVMLSNETASGKYPIKALNWMRRIVEKTESYLYKGLRHIL